MLAVLVYKDNPDVCSDPTLVTPSGTRIAARKDKEKALSKECVLLLYDSANQLAEIKEKL